MWITWKHEHTDFVAPLTLEQKVNAFYEGTLGWQLHIADLVANGGITFGEFKLGQPGYEVPSIRHSGFAVLHICLSYIELVGSLVISEPLSPFETFKAGVRVIPGLIDRSSINHAVLQRLYDGARCGLYHEGRIRPGVGLGQPPDGYAIAYVPRSEMIGISPERLPRVLKAHLEQLRLQLLDPKEAQLQARFEHRFDEGFASEKVKEARGKRRSGGRTGAVNGRVAEE